MNTTRINKLRFEEKKRQRTAEMQPRGATTKTNKKAHVKHNYSTYLSDPNFVNFISMLKQNKFTLLFDSFEVTQNKDETVEDSRNRYLSQAIRMHNTRQFTIGGNYKKREPVFLSTPSVKSA